MNLQRALSVLLLSVLSVFLFLSGAALAGDVSGTVSYGGGKTGRIYITLQENSPNGGSGRVFGTSIASAGTYTIRGVSEGPYILRAEMDVMGIRERHHADPVYVNSSVFIPASDVSGVDIALYDPVPATPLPPSRINGVPGDGSALIMWDANRNEAGVHGSETVNLYWSTDPSFLVSWPSVSPEGSVTNITASDKDNGYFHTGLTNGQTYYYLMTGSTDSLVSSQTVTAVLAPAAPVGGYEVSGTVNASGFDPSGTTLYMVLYSETDGVYYSIVNMLSTSQTFTVSGVQDGTYYFFPIFDLNGNGLLDPSDIEPNDGGPMGQVTVSGSSVSGTSVTVVNDPGSARVSTSHGTEENGCSEYYGINLRAFDGAKLIAKVSITGDPGNAVTINGPIDLGLNQWSEFSYWIMSGRPTVGDTFYFDMEYVDGYTETLTRTVTAVLDDFATVEAPLGVTAVDPTPTFEWSLSSSPTYTYTYQLRVSGPNTNWDMWDMLPSQLSAAYNANGRANPSTLSSDTPYMWEISLQDDNGNEVHTRAYFSMGSGISGTVTDGSTGIGCVEVSVSTSTDSLDIARTRTNPDGTYTIGGFGMGSYKVRFNGADAGYSDEYYYNKTSWSEADTVSVMPGLVTPGIDGVLEQSGSISGRVTNGSNGIPGVNVSACRKDNPTPGDCSPNYYASTDGNGDYVIGGLSSGSYKVQFSGASAGYMNEWYDNTPDANLATAVTVTAGATTAGIDAVLDQAGGISGTVTNGAQGLEGVFVYLCKYTGPTRQDCDFGFGGMNTDASGTYSLGGLPAGQYEVQFQGANIGYMNEWFNDSPDQAGSTLVTVTTGVTTTNINAVLAPAGAISGRVTNGATGILDVHVGVCRWNGTACDYGFMGASTDGSGSFTIGGLPAGDYKVNFWAEHIGYANEWWLDQPDEASADLVSVTTGSVTTLVPDVVLAQAGNISGRVTYGATGLAGAPVNVVDAVFGSYVQSTMTDSAGYYMITGLASGFYKVSFSADGYEGEWYNDKPSFETADAVTVNAGMTTTGIDAALSIFTTGQAAQIGVFRGNGYWYLETDGDLVKDETFKFGIAGDIPVTGDWNGDGTTDIGVFRGNGTWYLDTDGDRTWDVTFKFGMTGDIPVTGDWNGDGTTEVGLFRGNGYWYLDTNGNRAWNAGVDATFKFGIAGDIPVTGDWNGDGTTEVGLFRGNGYWYLDTNGNRAWNSGVDATFKFGMTGDIPVSGDWNGDGATEPGVFRGNGTWYIDMNGDRAWDTTFKFGMTGDRPVSGVWTGLPPI